MSLIFFTNKVSAPIHIHILNNNPDDEVHQQLHEQAVRFVKFRDTAEGYWLSSNVVVSLVRLKQNNHAFTRFLFARELMEVVALPRIIFIDDDQLFRIDFVTNLFNQSVSNPGAFITWYQKTFEINNTEYPMGAGDPILVMGKNVSEYGGPGGSIVDTHVFKCQQLFRLATDLKHWYANDDIWLSYIQTAVLGQRILKSQTSPWDIAKQYKTRKFKLPPYLQHMNLLFDIDHSLGGLFKNASIKAKATAAYRTIGSSAKRDMWNTLHTEWGWGPWMRIISDASSDLIDGSAKENDDDPTKSDAVHLNLNRIADSGLAIVDVIVTVL